MAGIVGIVALLTVLGVSLVITRIATVALVKTGLSPDAARFQARSAFTGTGYTTEEAETIVGHPVRRRIVMLLMILRSAGLVTVVISLILSFAGTGTGADRLIRLGYLVAGVVVLWLAANSRVGERLMSRTIEGALSRYTDLDVRDYASLLHLSGDYAVTEMRVEEAGWLEGKRLVDCRLDDEGVRVLGLYRRDGRYLGAPRATTRLRRDDTLVLYGHEGTLGELGERRADESGDRAHERAVDRQREREEREDHEDRRAR